MVCFFRFWKNCRVHSWRQVHLVTAYSSAPAAVHHLGNPEIGCSDLVVHCFANAPYELDWTCYYGDADFIGGRPL